MRSLLCESMHRCHDADQVVAAMNEVPVAQRERGKRESTLSRIECGMLVML